MASVATWLHGAAMLTFVQDPSITGAEGLGARRRAAGQAAAREAIFEVAEGLFLERGYEAVTLEQVAASCGVSVRTVLRYFSGKEDLALARHRAQFEEFSAGLASHRADVLSYWREHVLKNVSRNLEDQGESLRRTLQMVLASPVLSAHSAALFHQYEAVLADAIAEETGDTGFGPRLLASVLVAGNNAATQYWLAGRSEFSPELFTAVIDYAAETVPSLFPPTTLARRRKRRAYA